MMKKICLAVWVACCFNQIDCARTTGMARVGKEAGEALKVAGRGISEAADVITALSDAIEKIQAITPSQWEEAAKAAGKKIPATLVKQFKLALKKSIVDLLATPEDADAAAFGQAIHNLQTILKQSEKTLGKFVKRDDWPAVVPPIKTEAPMPMPTTAPKKSFFGKGALKLEAAEPPVMPVAKPVVKRSIFGKKEDSKLDAAKLPVMPAVPEVKATEKSSLFGKKPEAAPKLDIAKSPAMSAVAPLPTPESRKSLADSLKARKQTAAVATMPKIPAPAAFPKLDVGESAKPVTLPKLPPVKTPAVPPGM